MLNKSCWF